MYFTAETQALILNRMHFALRPDGVLFLGKAEMLLGGHVFQGDGNAALSQLDLSVHDAHIDTAENYANEAAVAATLRRTPRTL